MQIRTLIADEMD